MMMKKAMLKKTAVLALALATALAATGPALAKDAPCLSQNRIYSTKVLDNKTILLTDWSKRHYTVHMSGTCIGLNDGAAYPLVFRTHRSDLTCLRPGDEIGYRIPGAGFASCFIRSVTPGAPADSSPS